MSSREPERLRYRITRRAAPRTRVLGSTHQVPRDEFCNMKDEYRQGILEFHVHQCPHDCREAYCDMFHPGRGEKPRRKPERLKSGAWNYLPILCMQACGEPNCPFAHTEEEVMYHPLKYKVNPCEALLDDCDCCSKFGYFCPFFHIEMDKEPLPGLPYHLYKQTLSLPKLDSLRMQADYKAKMKLEDDDRPEEQEVPKPQPKPVAEAKPESEEFVRERYKTEQCMDPNCVSELCVFYHNSDERRREDDSTYTFSQCPDTYILTARSFKDPSKCPRGDSCSYSHTINEVYYHKDYYRTTPCSKASCRDKLCPFMHEAAVKQRPSAVQEVAKPVVPAEVPMISKPENDLQMSLLDRMCRVNADIGGLKIQIEEAGENLKKMEEQLACNHCAKPQQQFAFYCGHAFCQACVEGNIKQKTYICRKCNKPSAGLIEMKYI